MSTETPSSPPSPFKQAANALNSSPATAPSPASSAIQPARPRPHAVIVGGGVGGLSAAIALAAADHRVTLLESAAQPGGKMRTVRVENQSLDAGPTVLTLRPVFERIFAIAGTRLEDHLALRPLNLLARHYWADGSTLDLHADLAANEAAVERFSGAAEVDRFRRFQARAADIYNTLNHSFMQASRPNPISLAARIGFTHLRALWGIAPFESYWRALAQHFSDPRLVQLYGRYATYVGSSPFLSPATLMLIAHVEQRGVWQVQGGMHALAQALARVAASLGVDLRMNSTVRELRGAGSAQGRWQVVCDSGPALVADAVVVNADPAALASGRLGSEVTKAVAPTRPLQRSLSAVTSQLVARVVAQPGHAGQSPVALAHHTVFFSDNYQAEFDALFKAGQVPADPTVYVCAQDRDDACHAAGRERLMLLINAPARGDSMSNAALSGQAGAEVNASTTTELAAHGERIFAKLASMGLQLAECSQQVLTGPAEFERLFPGSGGALYGRVGHGWQAAFSRPGSRSALPGLYLAGGGVHPGAGVPMAALSGLQAAAAIAADATHD